MVSRLGDDSSIFSLQPSEVFSGVAVSGGKVEQAIQVAAGTAGFARFIAKIVGSTRDLSSSVTKALKATRGIGLGVAPFRVIHAAENAIKVIKEKNLQDKIWAAFKLILNLDSVADSIAGTCNFIYAFKTVSSRVVDWIPIFNIVSFFVGFISLGLAAESVGKSGKLVHDLQKVLKKLDVAKNDVEKAKILGDFLAKLEKQGVRPLFKKLGISKKAAYQGRLVEDRIKDLAKLRLIGGREKEAEVIVRGLAGRAKLDLGFKAADCANRIVTQIGKGFVAFAPFLPVGYIIMTSTGIISLLMIASKVMLISKNPFDPNDPKSRSRAVELVGYISNGISHLRARLHAISLWPIAHPAPVPVRPHHRRQKSQ
jgi:hypothetical protein